MMGEEGLHCCPLFIGPYKSVWALRHVECLSFNEELVGGGIRRGVEDVGGVIAADRREGWRTGSGWPLSRARWRDGDGNG